MLLRVFLVLALMSGMFVLGDSLLRMFFALLTAQRGPRLANPMSQGMMHRLRPCHLKYATRQLILPLM